METELDFTVTPARMEEFRRLSGDDNPLHSDADFAQARGFAGPVVYGALLVAEVSRLLGTRLPGPGCVWQSLSLKFRRPLYVGQVARLRAEVAHEAPGLGLTVLRLTIDSDRQRIAEGEARALLPGLS